MKNDGETAVTASPFDFAPPAQQDSGGDDMEIVRIVLKHKRLLTLGAVCGLVLGIAGYVKLGPEYEATSQILVSKHANVPINENHEAQTFGDRGEHIALIMSPMIVGKAFEKHHLDQLPSLVTSDDPIEDILDGLKVKRSAGHDQSFLNVLDISYKNSRKQDADVVVNAVIDAYHDYLIESHKENTSEMMQLISQAQDDLLKQIRDKKAEYLAFRNKAPVAWRRPMGADSQSGDLSNVHQERLKAIETELNSNLLEATRIGSRSKVLQQAIDSGQSHESLERLVQMFLSANAPAGTTGALPEPARDQSLQSQLLPLLLEQKNLLRDFGPDHPDVQAVQSKIKTLYDFYRQRGIAVPEDPQGIPGRTPTAATNSVDLVSVYQQSLQQQLMQLELRNAELQTLHDQESKLAKDFAGYQEQDQVYNEEILQLKSLWDVIVKRLKELELVKDNRGYTLKQIAPVRVELVMKRILKIVGAGTAFGMALAAALVYYRERRDTTLKSVGEIRRLLGRPVVGSIPTFDLDQMKIDETSGFVPALRYYHCPGSPEAEAYRSIRTALFVALGAEQNTVLQFTSPEPGDGKTTLTANLALAMAQTGKRVLLIDADMRRPRVHSLFGLGENIGLADVLLGDLEFTNAVRETTVGGLSLLTSGGTPENPAELLSSERFERLLQMAKHEFDYVLVDTPPLLVVSDPSIVARCVDGLLLVLRVSKSRRQAVQRATEIIESVETPLLGLVANDIEPTSVDGYGYADGYEDYVQPETKAATDNKSTTGAENRAGRTRVNAPNAYNA